MICRSSVGSKRLRHKDIPSVIGKGTSSRTGVNATCMERVMLRLCEEHEHRSTWGHGHMRSFARPKGYGSVNRCFLRISTKKIAYTGIGFLTTTLHSRSQHPRNREQVDLHQTWVPSSCIYFRLHPGSADSPAPVWSSALFPWPETTARAGP